MHLDMHFFRSPRPVPRRDFRCVTLLNPSRVCASDTKTRRGRIQGSGTGSTILFSAIILKCSARRRQTTTRTMLLPFYYLPTTAFYLKILLVEHVWQIMMKKCSFETPYRCMEFRVCRVENSTERNTEDM